MQRNNVQEQKPISLDEENREWSAELLRQLEVGRHGAGEGSKIYYKATVYKAVIIKRRWLLSSKSKNSSKE